MNKKKSGYSIKLSLRYVIIVLLRTINTFDCVGGVIYNNNKPVNITNIAKKLGMSSTLYGRILNILESHKIITKVPQGTEKIVLIDKEIVQQINQLLK